MVRLHDRLGGSPRNLRCLREHRFPTHNLGAKWREGSSSGWLLAPKVCQALWERCHLSSHGHTVKGGHHVHLRRRQARGVSNCYFQLLSRRAGSQVHPPTSQPAGPQTQHRVPRAGLCPGLDCTGQRDCVFTCHLRVRFEVHSALRRETAGLGSLSLLFTEDVRKDPFLVQVTRLHVYWAGVLGSGYPSRTMALP